MPADGSNGNTFADVTRVIKDDWCDPDDPKTIVFQDISAAAFKIKNGIVRTECKVSLFFVCCILQCIGTEMW
jgi:threonine dehydratase